MHIFSITYPKVNSSIKSFLLPLLDSGSTKKSHYLTMEIITTRGILQNLWWDEIICHYISRAPSQRRQRTSRRGLSSAHPQTASMAVLWIPAVSHSQLIFQPGEKRGKFVPSDRWTVSWKAGGVFGTPLTLKPPSNPFKKKKERRVCLRTL